MSAQPTAPALTNIRIIEDDEGIVAITCGNCSPLHDGGDGLTVRALTVEDDLSRRSPAACPECSTALDWQAPVEQEWSTGRLLAMDGLPFVFWPSGVEQPATARLQHQFFRTGNMDSSRPTYVRPGTEEVPVLAVWMPNGAAAEVVRVGWSGDDPVNRVRQEGDWGPYMGQGPEVWGQIVAALSDTITQIADDV